MGDRERQAAGSPGSVAQVLLEEDEEHAMPAPSVLAVRVPRRILAVVEVTLDVAKLPKRKPRIVSRLDPEEDDG